VARKAKRAERDKKQEWLWGTGDFGPPTGLPAKKTTKEREAEAKERTAKRQAEIDAKKGSGQ
jgi:hypothetical protein